MPLRAGSRLGPYEILDAIGAGGMGEVYRAHDPRLGRDVAIKVLPERLSTDAQALARFEREARAVAALSHQSILAIFDIGSVRGVTYVVTELLEGETLRARLARGALPWSRAVDVASDIADALAATHVKGIVHRDLKPENIFITTEGRAKLLDFGLARSTPVVGSADDTMLATASEPGLIMGTVGYMSPEQVRGANVAASSDIFSLGCVIYEMVAGRRAFAKETGAQTMAAILEQEPAPLTTHGHPVPAELERLVSRCLAKHPDERSQSAHDLSVALKDLISGGTANVVMTRPRGLTNVLWPTALLLTVLGGAWAFYGTGRAGAATDSLAILPFVNASGNPDMDYLGDGISESLINSLSRVPNLQLTSRSAAFRFRGKETDAQAAGRALKVGALLTGRVMQRGNDLLISAELIDVRNNRHLWGEQFNRRMTDLLAVQNEISTEISGKLRLRLTSDDRKQLTRQYTENTEAYQLYLRGRYFWNKKTPDGFNRGLQYFQQAIDVDPNYAPAHAGMAALYNNLANYNFALLPPRQAWVKAKGAARRALEIDDSLASAHTSLALIAYQWEWDWATAEKEFKRALELDPGSSTTYEPGPSSTNHWYAHYLMSMRRPEESFRASRRALELDPLDLANNAHQGWHHLMTGQYDTAIEPLHQTIQMDPNFPLSHYYLGLVFEQKGSFKDAITEFEAAVRLTAGRPSMSALLGHAYAQAGQKRNAEEILWQLSVLGKDRYVPSYPIATIHAALGQQDMALTALERAYDERDSWMGYLSVDPRLKSLHADPRFVDLIRRMGLP